MLYSSASCCDIPLTSLTLIKVKLGDFGIVRELNDEADLAQTMVGTIR